MISYLQGKLAEAHPTHVVLDVHGVGYHVLIPLSSFDKLPATGSDVKLLTHLQVREDAHILFGFATEAERDLFRLLLTRVTGVGPKLALAVLSGMTVPQFKNAVVQSDVAAIAKIQGLGKKTAERIVLELKDKVGVAAAWEAASAEHAASPRDARANDAVLALISLGYRQVEAHKAVRKIMEDDTSDPSTDEIVRQALKLLA